MITDMKKINYIFLGLVSALAAFTSCSKDSDFLAEKPKTIFTTENAFAKSSQVDAQVARCYNAFYNLHGWGTSVFAEFGGGSAANLLGGYGADCNDGNGEAMNGGTAFSNYSTLNTLTPRFLNTWNALYQLASYANLALQGAGLVEWEDQSLKAYEEAQAKFFLGWAYLRLGELFGGVPVVEEFNSDLKFDYVRSTRQETYQFAIDNLKAAVAGLPQYQKADGRLAQGAANHYLAEALLAQGIETGDNSYFTQAIAAADKVIADHPLMTERFGSRANPADPSSYKAEGNVFFDLFQIGNYNRSAGNTEALLVMQTPTYGQQSNNGGDVYQLGVITGYPYRGMRWNSKYEEGVGGPWEPGHVDSRKYPYGAGCAYLGGNTWGLVGSTHYMDEVVWESEFADDMRNEEVNLCHPICLNVDHSLYGQVVTEDMIDRNNFCLMRISAKVKMQDEWGWDSHHTMFGQSYMVQYGRDWYAARSAETYLIKAEAQYRNNDANGAAATINVVRSRAKAGKMLTGSEINMYTILDERARELSWEEHRWPTLLRLAKQGTENKVMHDQIMNHAMYVVDQPAYAGGTPSWSLFPIPGTVINLNTDAELTQNEGWK